MTEGAEIPRPGGGGWKLALRILVTVTFLALVFWAWLIGPLGAILAIPLTLLAKAMLVDVDPHAGWADALLRASATLAALGYPLLLSASNKTFLGKILDLELTERREASIGAAALGIAWGCRIVRVHDVRGTRRVRDALAAVGEAE